MLLHIDTDITSTNGSTVPTSWQLLTLLTRKDKW